MFPFDKAVPPKFSSKCTEKPNGKVCFSSNTEVLLDKSLGAKHFAKKSHLLKLNDQKVSDDQS